MLHSSGTSWLKALPQCGKALSVTTIFGLSILPSQFCSNVARSSLDPIVTLFQALLQDHPGVLHEQFTLSSDHSCPGDIYHPNFCLPILISPPLNLL